MKRIGLITLHRWFNYGSMLQAYAGNQLLNSIGYDCELIDYTPPRIDNNRSYKLYNEDTQWEKLREQYKQEILDRKGRFDAFMNLYKCSPKTYASDEELANDPPVYDAYITGSDQIWNVNMRIASKAYFLHFANSQEKYAFSTSIGRCKQDKLMTYKAYLDLYKKIYMREEEGKELIEAFCPNVDVGQMLDPTLILTREDWDAIVDQERVIEEDYIACYATLDDELDAMMPIIKRLHEEQHQPIVLFGMILPREETGIINMVDVGPREMIRLIRDANLLVTHSFHGTAFALNYNTPFMTYNDALENPRKEGVLRMVGLQNRIIHNEEEMLKIQKESVCFDEANRVLEQERIKARQNIRECLGE